MQQSEAKHETIQDTGLTHRDLERLAWLKIRFERGACTEFPMEYKRLLFARYLRERSLIHD
jgi:hypothetical protein